MPRQTGPPDDSMAVLPIPMEQLVLQSDENTFPSYSTISRTHDRKFTSKKSPGGMARYHSEELLQTSSTSIVMESFPELFSPVSHSTLISARIEPSPEKTLELVRKKEMKKKSSSDPRLSQLVPPSPDEIVESSRPVHYENLLDAKGKWYSTDMPFYGEC